MPLPTERDYDAVDAGPVSAATINAIQDALVAANKGEHAHEFVLVLPAAAGQVGSLGATSLGSSWGSDTGGARFVNFPLPLKMNDRITKLEVFVKEGNAAGETVTATLMTQDLDGSVGFAVARNFTTPTVPKVSGTSGAFAVLTWDSGVDDGFPLRLGFDATLGGNSGHLVRCELAATSNDDESRVYAVRVTWDHPGL